MQSSDIPAKFNIPFGNSAGGSYIRTIPESSQIGVNDGWASLTDGFVPLNATPPESGGIPPFMQDMNGILKQISAWSRWVGAGGPVRYDSTFQVAIGGYPKGALVQSAVSDGVWWVSLVENNGTNPDSGGAGWGRAPAIAATIADVIAGTSDNVSVTPASLKGAKYVRVVGESLNDNNGFIAYDTGFKEAWGFNNTLAGGGSQTIIFSSFMGSNAFTSFHRLTIGNGSSADVKITSTNYAGFTVHNYASSVGSYQWSTRGV